MTESMLFGGVCDRCGQLYLQRHFPFRCLCPSCLHCLRESMMRTPNPTDHGPTRDHRGLLGLKLAAPAEPEAERSSRQIGEATEAYLDAAYIHTMLCGRPVGAKPEGHDPG
jgi:hypothetical protein